MITVDKYALLLLILSFILSCHGIHDNVDPLVGANIMADSLNGYVEFTLDSQLVDISVFDRNVYQHEVVENGEEKLIGSGLFIWLCQECHAPNKLMDTTGFYDKKWDIAEVVLNDQNHGSWKEDVFLRIDSFDLSAIERYINRYHTVRNVSAQ